MRPTHGMITPVLSGFPQLIALHTRPSICVFCQAKSPRSRKATIPPSARRQASTHSSSSPHVTVRIGTPASHARFATTSAPPRSEKSIVDDLAEEDIDTGEDARQQDEERRYAEQLRQEEKAARQAQVDDAPNHHDYVPATTWNGMEMIGGEKEWDTGRKFKSFLPSTKYLTSDEITVSVYRAIVEIFAAFTAGRTPRTSQNYQVGQLVNESLQVRIDHDPEVPGRISLSYPSSIIQRAVLKAGHISPLPGKDSQLNTQSDTDVEFSANGTEELSNLEAVVNGASLVQDSISSDLASVIQSFGSSWLSIPLTDAKIKFALLKRITRIIGTPIPDSTVHEANSVSSLLAKLRAPKTSTKLYDVLSAQPRLANLANVNVAGRRITPIDKDMEVGRWKIIEAELQRRHLPVVGHG